MRRQAICTHDINYLEQVDVFLSRKESTFNHLCQIIMEEWYKL